MPANRSMYKIEPPISLSPPQAMCVIFRYRLCVYVYECKDRLLIDFKLASNNPTIRHSNHRHHVQNLWYSSTLNASIQCLCMKDFANALKQTLDIVHLVYFTGNISHFVKMVWVIVIVCIHFGILYFVSWTVLRSFDWRSSRNITAFNSVTLL